jgi:hypothetical protein
LIRKRIRQPNAAAHQFGPFALATTHSASLFMLCRSSQRAFLCCRGRGKFSLPDAAHSRT